MKRARRKERDREVEVARLQRQSETASPPCVNKQRSVEPPLSVSTRQEACSIGNFCSCREGQTTEGPGRRTARGAGVLEGQVEGIFRASRVDCPTWGHPRRPVSRPKSRLMRYVLPERDSACAAATTPASRRSDICEGGCGLTGRQRGVFNHHAALWGRPFIIAASPLEPGARRGEPTTARLVHHINSDGPRAPIIESKPAGSPHESAIASGRRRSGGAAASFAWLLRHAGARPSALLHAPDARAHVESCERLHSKYVLR